MDLIFPLSQLVIELWNCGKSKLGLLLVLNLNKTHLIDAPLSMNTDAISKAACLKSSRELFGLLQQFKIFLLGKLST